MHLRIYIYLYTKTYWILYKGQPHICPWLIDCVCVCVCVCVYNIYLKSHIQKCDGKLCRKASINRDVCLCCCVKQLQPSVSRSWSSVPRQGWPPAAPSGYCCCRSTADQSPSGTQHALRQQRAQGQSKAANHKSSQHPAQMDVLLPSMLFITERCDIVIDDDNLWNNLELKLWNNVLRITGRACFNNLEINSVGSGSRNPSFFLNRDFDYQL